MPYSTEAELKNNIKQLEATFTAVQITALYTERIAFSDKIIQAHLSNLVDFTNVNNTVPLINVLSQYKTAELTLVRLGSIAKQAGETSDLDYWQTCYNHLLKQVLNGELTIVDANGDSLMKSSGTFSNESRDNVRPFFGYGEHGEWINDTELSNERESMNG